MNKRPLAVTLLSLLIAASGAAGLIYHLAELDLRHPFQDDTVWIALIRVLAIVCGVYMLRGHNWARWLAMAWIGFHVVVSGFDSLPALAFHAVMFAIFAYFLFRKQAYEYFRHASAK